MEGEVRDQSVNCILINLNMFIPSRCILRLFFSKLQTFCSHLIFNDNILSEITSANALVLAETFSVKFAFI